MRRGLDARTRATTGKIWRAMYFRIISAKLKDCYLEDRN